MALRSRSLGTRWALRFGLVAGLTLAALFAFVHDRVQRLVRSSAEEVLEVLIEDTHVRPGETPEAFVRRLEGDVARTDPDEKVAFVLWDAGGEQVLALGHAVSARAPGPPPELDADDTVFREHDLGSKYPYWSLTRGEADGGAAQAVLYGREYLRRGQRIEYAFLATLPIAALGFGLLGAVMTRSFLRPVRGMVTAMEGMGARSLDERLPLSGRGDELDRIAASFNRLMDRLQESFATLRRFTGDAAHQLRHPVTALRARIEVAQRDAALPPEARTVLEGLLDDVRRLSEVVDAMLHLARYSAGLDARQRQPVDLAHVAAEVVEFLAPFAEEQRVALSVEGAGSAPVQGDASWLRQLLVNLLENAVEHTPADGAIVVRVEAEAGAATLRVEDSGPGIPETERARVFERFFRASGARGPGLGLGLAIAKEIAEVHDGSLRAEARAGGGTRIVFRMPLDPPPA